MPNQWGIQMLLQWRPTWGILQLSTSLWLVNSFFLTQIFLKEDITLVN